MANEDKILRLEISKFVNQANLDISHPHEERVEDPLAPLIELSMKIQECVAKQKQVRFISKEISQILKKRS